MTREEYAAYEAAVADFMAREKLENLSTGRFQCKDCEVRFGDDDKCPECDADREMQEEAWFSWSPCDCCGCSLGGDREYASGAAKVKDGSIQGSGYEGSGYEIFEYEICTDCVYYAAYGRLDDTTMMQIDKG